MVIKIMTVMMIGFAEGIAVGGGFVAFLSVLGVIPRLTQLTKTKRFIRGYEWSVISGTVLFGWLSLRNGTLGFSPLLLIPFGLCAGIFVGMLAAALTEVLNVLPILAKRIGFDEKILLLLMAIVFGKICGSLFHWLYFVNQ
ncbi:stage V sporulation protein AB [Bacillus taeanensis]|uniref:Stage V sporulation protein AB n=1 Tax=Bacillus taeanensis TaxID=273032 RepID=A0A366XXS9_9BACI|nr:stage V sporulation protein AB [Bacillus taeanensis]RBW70368.1 stage V sporulation protein AB [Bacillus taeanensis]